MSKLHGVFYGLNMHTHNQEQEINKKSYAHQVLQQPVEYKYNPVPQGTRCTKFPCYINNNNNHLLSQNTNLAFVPNAKQGTFNGYMSHIDDETILRNQTFALQKSDKSVYVPDSTSDLYQATVNNINGHPGQHNLLWNVDVPSSSSHNVSSNIGFETFNNHTRVQRNN